MDILILNNYINKFTKNNEVDKAMKYVKSFIEARSDNYDYYIIMLNSVVENENEMPDNLDCAVLGTLECQIDQVFLKDLFAAPIPNKSICFRQDGNPFVKSNPYFGAILNEIKITLEKSNEEVGCIYILSPENVKGEEILSLKQSIQESEMFNLEKTKIILIGI